MPDIPPSLFANASSDAGEQALLEATRRREAFQHAKLEARSAPPPSPPRRVGCGCRIAPRLFLLLGERGGFV